MFIGGQRYELHFFSYNIRRFIYFSGFIADVGEEIVSLLYGRCLSLLFVYGGRCKLTGKFIG
jgi:hypothetical protein